MDKNLYINKLEKSVFKEMMDTVAFDDEVMFYYNNYTLKMKKPDLLGKTLKVSEKQFPKIFNIVNEVAAINDMNSIDVFIYEDFYYGIESKGSDKPWIEISSKTLIDFNDKELEFLIAREMCSIKLNHTYYKTLIEESLKTLDSKIGSDTVYNYWKIITCKWNRVINYTQDAFGYIYCQDIKSCIGAIKKLILNSTYLAENVNISEYIKQAEEINRLDDDVYNLTKADEMVPYGPFRIKNLIAYASSDNGIEALKQMKIRGYEI